MSNGRLTFPSLLILGSHEEGLVAEKLIHSQCGNEAESL